MIPILLTKEQKSRNIKRFYRTKLNLLNLKCSQDIEKLRNSLGDLIDFKTKIYKKRHI